MFPFSRTIEIKNKPAAEPLLVKPVPSPVVPRFNLANISGALAGHESRGAASPANTVNPVTKATGATQITPVMFKEWKDRFATDKNLARNVNFNKLNDNPELQQRITDESVQGILNKYQGGLKDWPTLSKKLKTYKQEIKMNFNHPVYWAAGEWVAGPNWVAKLDNKTAPGAKETVRDYLNAVGQRYFGQQK